MTKFPIVEYFCTRCVKTFCGTQKNDECPICLTPLIKEAT